MSKRSNKSRFVKSDVNRICELQRTIDAYESYIMCLVSSIQHKYEPDYRLGVLMKGTDMDGWVDEGWNNLRELKKEVVVLRDNSMAVKAKIDLTDSKQAEK